MFKIKKCLRNWLGKYFCMRDEMWVLRKGKLRNFSAKELLIKIQLSISAVHVKFLRIVHSPMKSVWMPLRIN